MKMKMRRVILFTRKIDRMTAFYRDVMGLKLITDEKGWKELAAGGGVRIALHSGPPTPPVKGPKLGFMTKDVAKLQTQLNARGGRFGKVRPGAYQLCDGKDPDGNAISLSNR
jgi:catechol 2,3-dioxygenase-like lactoylglutathione lyase family enzyme